MPKQIPDSRKCEYCHTTFVPKSYNQKYCTKKCRRMKLNEQNSSIRYRSLFYAGDIGEERKRIRHKRIYPKGLEWMSKFEDIIQLQLKTGKSYGQLQPLFDKKRRN